MNRPHPEHTLNSMAYKTILHLSDVHIRMGDTQQARYDEYVGVIDRMLQQFATYDADTTLIVVTGDLFHDKSKLGPCAHLLATRLLSGLSRMRTLVIRGNHDYRQDQPDEPDLIKPFLNDLPDNLEYLDETGQWQIGNIEFGLVAVQETLVRGAGGGIVSTLPPFPTPSPVDEETTHRIALFHGSVGGAKLQNGTDVEDRNNYPLAWFAGYDIIMLGDIHVQQVHRAHASAAQATEFDSKQVKGVYKTGSYTLDTTKSPWGYAGSLVQQNFGESLWGHGFVEWNLDAKTITTYHVRNDYGMVLVALDDQGNPTVKFRMGRTNQQLPLKTVQAFGWFPKNVSLRFSMNARNEITEIQTSFERAGIAVRDTGFADENNTEDVSTAVQAAAAAAAAAIMSDLSDLNSAQTWIRFFEEQGMSATCQAQGMTQSDQAQALDQDQGQEWTKWVEHPHLLLMQGSGGTLPDLITAKIKDRNTRIEKVVDAYTLHREQKAPIRLFRIHYIEFANLLCYGPGNYINFDTFVKQVCLLNGNNGAGKSAALEILCIAIFGEVFPSRANKSNSAAIINQHKAKHESAHTKICFSINGKSYWINRVFEAAQKNPRNLQQKSIWLADAATGEQIHVNANMVDEWVRNNIGPFSQFLLTTIMSQSNDSDFFAMTQAEQKRIIDSLLNLTVCEDYASILKEAALGYDYILDQLTVFEAGNKSTNSLAASVSKPESEIAAMEAQLKGARTAAATLEAQAAAAKAGFSEVAERVFQFPLNHYEIEAKQLASTVAEAPESDLVDLKAAKATHRDRMAVLRSKRFQANSTVPVRPLYDFDTAERKLLDLRTKRQGLNSYKSRIYDSQAEATWRGRYNTWRSVNPDVETELSLKEAEKELRQAREQAAVYETVDDPVEPVSERILAGLYKTHQDLVAKQAQLELELRLQQKEEATLAKILSPQALAEIKAYKQALKHLQTLFGCEPQTATEQLKRAATILRQQERVDEQIATTKADLTELGSVLYNDKCKACTNNPYRLKKESLEARLNALKEESDQLEDQFSECFPTATSDEYDDLTQAAAAFTTKATDQVKALIQQQNRHKALSAEIANTNAASHALRDQIEENDYEGQQAANEYYELHRTLHAATLVAEAARYAEEEQEWIQAKQQNELDQQIAEAEKQALAAYTAEARTLEIQLTQLDQEIERHEEATKAQTRLQEIAVIRKAYPYWQNYSELEQKIKPLRSEIASVEATVAQARNIQQRLAETQNLTQQLALYRTYLTTRLATLNTMAEKFKLYTNWLYPNRVKPMLENAVNSVLKSIPLPRPISFVAEWEDGQASWYVQDGTSRPSFEKASGAQRFFVSLALRLAFSRMGTSNMVNGQIFLDEGFTACDAETMDHIPGLLRSMLQQMEHLQTIFIVSHLDTLKSAATTQIRIHRGAQNSSLMVGERIQTIKPVKQNAKVLDEDGEIATAPVKKRGRPAKAIQVAE